MKNRRTSPWTPQAAAASRQPLADSRRPAGYTLLELLVAMTIMIVLGAGLIALLKEGIQKIGRASCRERV